VRAMSDMNAHAKLSLTSLASLTSLSDLDDPAHSSQPLLCWTREAKLWASIRQEVNVAAAWVSLLNRHSASAASLTTRSNITARESFSLSSNCKITR